MDKISVVCFGEILWDILPDVKRPGGAPMNVAYHLQKLGLDSSVISRIGEDDLGKDLLNFVSSIGLNPEMIQKDTEHATSAVMATMNEAKEVSYEILYPVAWDFITWKPEYEQLLENSEAFVFGSLASRNQESAATLVKMLEYAKYKVFDVNLRAPHYSPELIGALMKHADLLKLNAEELNMISNWLEAGVNNEAEQIEFLFKHFPLKEILITKGAAGASYYSPDYRCDSISYKVNVNDTIGSGDSFLAAFIAKKLQGADPLEAINYAVGMGAFITSKSGACPSYDLTELESFLKI